MILYSGSMIPGFMRNSAPKEYKCDRRDTGQHPPFVFQTFYSPNLSPHFCTALPARLTEQAGRGWESQIFVRRRGVLSLQSMIYIL